MNKLPYGAQDADEPWDEGLTVMSSTECTGLIPASPASEAEVDSYTEIYDIPLSKDSSKANHGLQNTEKFDSPSKE